MIVLFEGVDGGGKTTLLSRLLKTFPGSQELEWPGKKNRTPAQFLEAANSFIEEHKDKVNDSKLYFVDRCGLGEFIYGPLTEGRVMSNLDEYSKVFKGWLKDKLLIVCMNPDAHKLAIERGEDGPAKDPQFHKYITAGYRALANGTGLHLLGYNFQKDPEQYEAVVGAILAHRVVEVMRNDNS